MRRYALSIATNFVAAMLASSALAVASAQPPEGAIQVPGFVLPFSEYGSQEARDDLVLKSKEREKPASSRVKPASGNEGWVDRALVSQLARYPVKMTDEKMGGVGVRVFVPKGGVSPKNADRVLISLHGGGFQSGWESGSQIESIPISAVGGIKVVSVDYRLAPKNRFPSAQEDVASVYKELLKTHKPSQIGIYGCSAGGVLGPQSIAWFQKVGLPTPAALTVFSGSLTRITGDSVYMAGPLGGRPQPKIEIDPLFDATTGGFFKGMDPKDPLMWPAASKDVLAKFPPTLLLTGVRGIELSATTRSHLDLVNAGVDARLFLWEGVGHCFTYNPDIPESRDAYKIVANFFDEMMDRAEREAKQKPN